jgi:hypothetical protein
MEEYQRLDPYSRSRYEHGIDSKIVIMGNSGTSIRFSQSVCSFRPTGVGKTSLLYRYTQNKFDPKNTTSTSGAFFVTKKVYVNGLKVRLQLWDTAGQERFRSMVSFFPPFHLQATGLPDSRHPCTTEVGAVHEPRNIS